MKSIGEFLSLLPLFWKVRSFLRTEESKVQEKFYVEDLFKQADLLLKKLYRFSNPYALCRQESKDVYGETPLTVFHEMFQRGGLCSKDLFVDLGSGRGRGVIFASSVWKCVALGIDLVPQFCQKAQKAAHQLPVHFMEGDFTLCDLPQGTFFYLYAITLEESKLQRVLEKLKQIPQGARVVTVSFPLDPPFALLDSWQGIYPWGEATLYLHIKK